MKKHSPLSLKHLGFLSATLIAFCSLTIFLFTFKQDEKRFTNITSRLFSEEMTANTLSMHYTIAVPEDFGITDYTPLLPCYDKSASSDSRIAIENTLTSLRELRSEKLSPQDAYLHKLLCRYLENTLRLKDFDLYSEPLSPSSGMQTELPILLAEYAFRSERDVTDYLSLLDQTDEYFASLLTFEQEKKEAGLLMPASCLKKVREQCDTIVTSEELEAGTHFLQTTFQERLNALLEAKLLTEKKAAEYTAENDRLLKTVLLPAYIALGDGLLLLEDKEIPLTGLAALPDGKEYYKALLISRTGSSRPVEEIQAMLTDRFTSEYDALRELLYEHPDAAALYRAGVTPLLTLTKTEAILSDLKDRMTENFPTIPGPDTAATVKSVCESLEKYCAPAFYLTAPLDDTSQNVIYINQRRTPNSVELYTTLAHEGYPGHLYQTVYSNRLHLTSGERPLRELLWYGGYLEGWGLYTEFLSYDYASGLLQEQNRPEEAVLVQIEKHNRSLQLCLYSLLDIMIHYEGATYEHIASVLQGFGIENSSDSKAIYTYIVQEPCNYLKYYLGYTEITELQREALALWGNGYTALRFHSFLLDNGPADFTSLREQLYAGNAANSPR